MLYDHANTRTQVNPFMKRVELRIEHITVRLSASQARQLASELVALSHQLDDLTERPSTIPVGLPAISPLAFLEGEDDGDA